MDTLNTATDQGEPVETVAEREPMVPPVEIQRPAIPAPVVLEIQNRIQMSRLIDSYLFPQELGSDFEQINSLLGPCTRFEWNRPIGCNFSPNLRVQGWNVYDEKTFELVGPLQSKYMCQCLPFQSSWPFLNGDVEILSFGRGSVLCSPFCCCRCGTKLNSIQVYIPSRDEPIGQIEYASRSFSEKTVTITNYVTNETFIACAAPNSHPDCPTMLVNNSSGGTVAVCGVKYARIYRGINTYIKIHVAFPDAGMAATTKAIMMTYGTIWQMDHQQTNARYYIVGLLIIMMILTIFVLVLVYTMPNSSIH